ncbi:hypothetical protein GQ457_02G029500 [Hibiscus cannabinus]
MRCSPPPPFQRDVAYRYGWTAPVENVIKSNFDSAYNALSKESISGIICRDSVGFIMAYGIIPYWLVADAFVVDV